jgi:hypothetical protein
MTARVFVTFAILRLSPLVTKKLLLSPFNKKGLIQ